MIAQIFAIAILALPASNGALPLPPPPYQWVEIEAARPIRLGSFRAPKPWLAGTRVYSQEGGLDESNALDYGLRYVRRGGEYDVLIGLRQGSASGTGVPGRDLGWNGASFRTGVPFSLSLDRLEAEALVSLNGAEQEGEYLGVLMGLRYTAMDVEASGGGVKTSSGIASTYPAIGACAQFPIFWRLSGRAEFLWTDADGLPSGSHATIRCQRYAIDMAVTERVSVQAAWRIDEEKIDAGNESADLASSGPAALLVVRF